MPLIQFVLWQRHLPGSYQCLLFQSRIVAMQGDQLCNWEIPVADNDFFTGSNPMEERAEAIFQLRDIYRDHMAIMAMFVTAQFEY